MSEEGRRVFKMDTILALLAGKESEATSDLLRFLTQRELSSQEEGIVTTLAKAWLFSMNPPFMDCKLAETDIYDEWVAKECKRLGDNLSVEPIPADELSTITGILDTLVANKATIAEQGEKIAELDAKVAELAPFEGKTADLEKKVEDLTGKVEGLETEKAELKKETAGFAGKIAVAESELNSTISDIVTKALKDAVASVPTGGGAAADGEAAAEEAPAEEAGGGVPDDFGFGASGDDSDGFGF